MDSAEKKKMLRVLIAGAGIAGPALAFWLSRLGHTCTIVERSSELRSHGQQIDIRMQGLEAVERMGLLEDVRKIVVDQPAVQFVDAQGKCCAKFPGFDQGFVTETEVMRGDLCNLLVEKTKDTTEYRFGLSVVSFQNKKDGVTVTFSDDTSDTYDMLVAADGQGSRIRRSLLLEDEPDCARSLGVNIAFFTISRQPGDSNIASVYVAPGKRAMVTRFHSATHGQGYFFSMSRTEELKKSQRMDVALQKELWASIFRDAGWQSDRLVSEMLRADDFHAQSSTQIRAKTWSKGRVVCLGDSGYCPTSFTGMGASLALVGAYVLAGEISESPDRLDVAISSYERILRPLVKGAQRIPPGVPGLMHPEKGWAIKVLQFVLWAVVMIGLERPLQAFVFKKTAWNLPDYPRLRA